MKSETSAIRFRDLGFRWWPAALILAVLLPSIFWIVNDHHVWPYDQAWYGEVSVDLWFTLTRHFSDWWPAMVAAFGTKAPGVAWIGQFLVPLGQAFGSVEIGLLLSVLAAQAGTLLFTWKIAEELVPGRRLAVCLSLLVVATAPLFVAMSHQYLVEPLQLFSVAYFFFLAVKARRMNKMLLLGNLLIATAIALAAKITSPIYCALPGLIAAWALFQKREASEDRSLREVLAGICSVLIGLAMCAVCAKWYITNLAAVREILKLQTSPEFTIHYGRAGAFFPKVLYWIRALQWSCQMPAVIIGQLILFGIGIFVFRSRTDDGNRPPGPAITPLNLLSIASVLHILGVISLCSLNYNEENRYLLPLLPSVVVIELWLVRKVARDWIIGCAVALFCFQWVVVCSQALGKTRPNPSISYWVIPLDKSRTAFKELTRTVHKTSTAKTDQRTNIVGVELPWLNANSMSFFAAKARLSSGKRCFYTSVDYEAKDLDIAQKAFDEIKPDYFITLEESALPSSADFLNGVSIPILRRVRSDPHFVPESFSSKLNVIIFHRSDAPSTGSSPAVSSQ